MPAANACAKTYSRAASFNFTNGAIKIKYLLHSWGYPRDCLWVDFPSKTVFCGPDIVAKTNIENDELVIQYGDGWDSWDLFVKDVELKNMIEQPNAK